MNVCPFKMQAGMIIEAQKTRLAVAGRSESSPMQIDLACIGVPCMMYVKTGEEDGRAKGACGVALAPIVSTQLGMKIDDLNSKLDAITVGTVEAIEDAHVAQAEYLTRVAPGSKAEPVGVLHFLAKRLRAFFSTPEPAKPAKPNLSAVPKET